MQIAFDQRVIDYIAVELKKSPDVEEGGKYVGYLLRERHPQLKPLGLDPRRPATIITDFLPSGPNAVRTAVELQPDGEYQEALFRRLEAVDSSIEHLGTWHSHHCNGLQTLSSGDVAGYLRTVNRREYRPDVFIASLVKRVPHDVDEPGWIDHYLFVKGDEEFYRITDLVRFMEYPTIFGDLTGHRLDKQAISTHSRGQRDNHPPAAEDVVWYESDEGRAILAEDKRYLADRFGPGVTATRRGQAITMTARAGRVTIATTYPDFVDRDHVVISMRSDEAVVMEISTTLRWRRAALAAAFVAADNV
jgi:hypothetical protein